MIPFSSALLAAFCSGFAWAGLDIARKSLARDFSPLVLAAGLSGGLTLLFGGWTLLSPSPLRLPAYVGPAAASIALSLAIQLLILESMRRGELSRTIPLLSMTPVATSLFGLLILSEAPTVRQWTGIGLVFLGALDLGLSRSRTGGESSIPARFRLDAAGMAMLVAAFCISAAAPFDKLAVAASSPAVHGFVQSLATATALLLYLGWRGRLGQVAAAFRTRATMSLAVWLVFAALGLQLVAYQGVMVGMVETIKRVVGLGSSLLAGRLIFQETITPRKLVTVALMAVGVALLLG